MIIKKITIIWIACLLLILLSACVRSKNNVLEPSKLFYVHDLNYTLLNATSWSIFNYGQELYEDSKADDIPESIQGSQVAVLAHVGDESQISSTEIFNSWGIGEHDMGILIILFFHVADDMYVYDSLIFEIGSQMSEHLSAFEANELISTYFDDPFIPDFDYDARLMSLYYGVLSFIYLNVYDYDSYDHTSYMDSYYEIQYEYISAIPRYSTYESWLSSPWFWIILVSIIIFGGSIFQFLPMLFMGSGIRFKGGGGKSIGYWFKR